MEVRWSEPSKNTINGQLRGYRVYYYSIKNPKQVFNRTVNKPNERNVTLTGLRKFTTYKVKVAAFTRVGNGVKSRPRAGTTLEDSKYKKKVLFSVDICPTVSEPSPR